MSVEEMLDNLPWHALHTEHAQFAISAGGACRYPADVTPFGATADNGAKSVSRLVSLLTPGETIYLMGGAPAIVSGLTYGNIFPCLQMVAPDRPEHAPEPDSGDLSMDRSIARLSAADAPAMAALTDVAFPGFFRMRTCEMGVYFGIRIAGELVAMAGERMALPGWREVSGVCTHPEHRGNGYAVMLISHLMKVHADTGMRSFLHVSSSNTAPIAIYKRLGFSVRREVLLYPVSRSVL
jgi:ribosomal protein S18 acetylase RimI-like enzyme